MQGGDTRLKVQRALLYYFRKRLRLNVADVLDDPQEVPMIVTNLLSLRRLLKKRPDRRGHG